MYSANRKSNNSSLSINTRGFEVETANKRVISPKCVSIWGHVKGLTVRPTAANENDPFWSTGQPEVSFWGYAADHYLTNQYKGSVIIVIDFNFAVV